MNLLSDKDIEDKLGPFWLEKLQCFDEIFFDSNKNKYYGKVAGNLILLNKINNFPFKISNLTFHKKTISKPVISIFKYNNNSKTEYYIFKSQKWEKYEESNVLGITE